MNMRHKIVPVLLILSLTAMMFFPISSNAVLSSDGDSVNPVSLTNPLDGIAPAGVDDPYNATILVLEEETVWDADPDLNLHGTETGGGIFVGRHGSGAYGRGWFKFDLPEVSSATIRVASARMYAYLENPPGVTDDAPIGAYYSDDDSWSETTLTWNNQPSFDGVPLDLIDNPASPDMFVALNYYSWDITSAVSTALMDDGYLSIMLRQVNESIDYTTFKYFVEEEYNSSHAAYIEVEWYTVPATSSSFDGTIPVVEDVTVIDTAPDTNYNDNGGLGGIFLGRHISGYYGRGWFKFDLSDVPSSLQITSARMYVYLENEYGDLVDAPIGAYLGHNDSWTETTLT